MIVIVFHPSLLGFTGLGVSAFSGDFRVRFFRLERIRGNVLTAFIADLGNNPLSFYRLPAPDISPGFS
jgi:hypothetical protein